MHAGNVNIKLSCMMSEETDYNGSEITEVFNFELLIVLFSTIDELFRNRSSNLRNQQFRKEQICILGCQNQLLERPHLSFVSLFGLVLSFLLGDISISMVILNSSVKKFCCCCCCCCCCHVPVFATAASLVHTITACFKNSFSKFFCSK